MFVFEQLWAMIMLLLLNMELTQEAFCGTRPWLILTIISTNTTTLMLWTHGTTMQTTSFTSSGNQRLSTCTACGVQNLTTRPVRSLGVKRTWWYLFFTTIFLLKRTLGSPNSTSGKPSGGGTFMQGTLECGAKLRKVRTWGSVYKMSSITTNHFLKFKMRWNFWLGYSATDILHSRTLSSHTTTHANCFHIDTKFKARQLPVHKGQAFDFN